MNIVKVILGILAQEEIELQDAGALFGLSRSTFYRRMNSPRDFRYGELLTFQRWAKSRGHEVVL